jgi:hypothetical protein
MRGSAARALLLSARRGQGAWSSELVLARLGQHLPLPHADSSDDRPASQQLCTELLPPMVRASLVLQTTRSLHTSRLLSDAFQPSPARLFPDRLRAKEAPPPHVTPPPKVRQPLRCRSPTSIATGKHSASHTFPSACHLVASRALSQRPQAEDCDDAIREYDDLRYRLNQLEKPSSMRGGVAVIRDSLVAVGKGTWAVLRFTASIPSRVVDFYSMNKEDYAAWKSKLWAGVKHEAHHYWVRARMKEKDGILCRLAALLRSANLRPQAYVPWQRRLPPLLRRAPTCATHTVYVLVDPDLDILLAGGHQAAGLRGAPGHGLRSQGGTWRGAHAVGLLRTAMAWRRV